MTESLEFEVIGLPSPQGSKRAFVNKHTGRAAIVDVNAPALRDWRSAIRQAAVDAMGDTPAPYYAGAVAVRLSFRFPRPASVKRVWPSVAPDVDKIARAALDALTQAGVWEDDARVVQLLAQKVYADRGGLSVEIRPVL